MSAAETVTLISQELESQSLNAVVAGFSFAAALSWMDLVRWLVNQVVKVNKNGGMNYTLTALFTTLLSIVVYLSISRVSTRVQKPVQPLYAVTR
jgi:di/tricarboxylate transporter